MSRVALVRHPALRGASGICYGRMDLPLLDPEADIPRIAAQVAFLLPCEVHTSPSSRCRIVAERLGGTVRADPRLQELDFGDWEGLAWDDVPRDQLDLWASDPAGFAPPGGESGATLVARVRDYAQTLRAAGPAVIVVSHAGPLKILQQLRAGTAIDLLAPSPAFGSVLLG